MGEVTESDRKFLQYVESTAGNATMDDFEDDWAPIGRDVLYRLGPLGKRLICMPYDAARGRQYVQLTDAGREALLPPPPNTGKGEGV